MKKRILIILVLATLIAAPLLATTYKSKGGKNDMDFYDGIYKTFTRRISSGGELSVRKLRNVVDVLEVYGDGATPDSNDLSTAVNTMTGDSNFSEATLELSSGTWPITANLTIPATMSVHLVRGAYLNISSGVTLTVSGMIYAEEDSWYSSTGTVVLTGAEYFSIARLEVIDDLKVGDDTTIGGKASVASTLTVTGAIDANSTSDFAKTVAIQGAIDANDTSDFAKTVDINAVLDMNSNDIQNLGTIQGSAIIDTLTVNNFPDIQSEGALVTTSSGAQDIGTGASANVTIFNSEVYDDNNYWVAGTPSRLTIPTGISRVIVSYNIEVSNNSASTDYWMMSLYKNGSAVAGGPHTRNFFDTNDSTLDDANNSSAMLVVSAGDYFQIYITNAFADTLTIPAAVNRNWFSIRAIQ